MKKIGSLKAGGTSQSLLQKMDGAAKEGRRHSNSRTRIANDLRRNRNLNLACHPTVLHEMRGAGILVLIIEDHAPRIGRTHMAEVARAVKAREDVTLEDMVAKCDVWQTMFRR